MQPEAQKAQTWRKVEEVFHGALAQPAEKRGEFLERVLPNDPTLRAEVASLLKAYESDDSLLDGSAASAVAQAPVLLPGDKLGSFEIVGLLGRGGMGEVYRARDLRLRRDVAIKVLASDVSDSERRRLLHEAQAASALNHPNIVTVYDVGEHNGMSYIAMECVAGKTLDALIPTHGMPLADVLKIAGQVASALAEAHAAGIVHRDLKPNNVMMTGSGVVKVLDFGLAKRSESTGPDQTTLTEAPKTEPGMILGSVGYMSPEQAEGRPVDARSDIFSFGSMLYEMVSGRRAFRGDTNLATLAAIVRDEPAALGTSVPASLRKIVAKCLTKDRECRYQRIDDAKLALATLHDTSGVEWTRLWPILAAAVAAVALFYAIQPGKDKATKPTGAAELIPLVSHGWAFESNFSRDGNQVVFSWNGERQDNVDIYTKLVGSPGLIGSSALLRLTSDPGEDRVPAFSPDGMQVGFIRTVAGTKRHFFMTVPAIGGQETNVAEITNPGRFDWLPDGKHIMLEGLKLLALDTGEISSLTHPPEAGPDVTPAISPSGHTIAFSRVTTTGLRAIYLLDVDGEFKPQGSPRQLTSMAGDSSWPAWTSDGHIVFQSSVDWSNTLWRVAVAGSRTPEHLSYGQTEKVQWPAVSRSGNRLLYSRVLGDHDIFRVPLSAAGTAASAPTPFISSTREDISPRFSADGKRIVLTSDRGGTNGIWVSDAEGSSVWQIPVQSGKVAEPAWSPDGARLVYNWGSDIYIVKKGGGAPTRLTSTTGHDSNLMPAWSHDGNWIYFTGFRGGQHNVWKMPAKGGEAVQLTKTGGGRALESPDGKFIYYSKDGLSTSPLYRMPSSGGEEVQVLASVARVCSFAVVSQGIYFYSGVRGADGTHTIQFLNFATGKVTAVTKPSNSGFQGVDASPDGSALLYSQIERPGLDLMLVNNFR